MSEWTFALFLETQDTQEVIMSYSNIIQKLFPSVKSQNAQTEPLPGRIPNHAGGTIILLTIGLCLSGFSF